MYIRATITVFLTLIAALVATGMINASYRRERARLADRHFTAGQALLRVNDLTGAAEEFRKALLFAPDNNRYELSLATALVNGGRLDEAKSHLEQLAQSDPTNGEINLLLAEVAEKQHHDQEAIEAYQRAVYEYWPPEELSRRREARWKLINLLQQSGRNRDQLVGELLQLYSNLPPHSDQRMKLGKILMQEGADSEAAHVFHDIIRDAGTEAFAQSVADQVGAHSGLAKIAFRSGDFVNARHEYQRVLKLAPDDLKTASALEVANDVIDMAPELPNISSAERLRRSLNLLKRVDADLEHCIDGNVVATPSNSQDKKAAPQACPNDATGDTCNLNARLESARELIDHKPSNSDDKQDRAAEIQQAAVALWRDRAKFCGNNQFNDPALEAVIPRLEQQ